jgi:hypothetical protein
VGQAVQVDLYRQALGSLVNLNFADKTLDPEWQAWEFARALLMPKHLIVEYCNQELSLNEMAKHFDLNPAFVEVRLKTLNFL